MRTVRTGCSKLLLSLALALALLAGGVPAAQAHATPAALTQPVEIAPPGLTTPAAQDFSDADFQQADQAELGNRTGGASRITQEEWLLIIGGALLLLLILILIF